jgi:tRNASer (uridine44-2'-O)-methyltransferase
MSYIDFLKETSTACGFKTTLIDRLKIPSTKRICIIGLDRSYEMEKFHEQSLIIESFISTSNEQNQTFVPREKVQAVRNCTKTDRNLTEKIVKVIFEALLEEERTCNEYGDWNCGKELLVADAVKLISQDDLKKLKSECGGLQTLLKNKHQIFEIYGGCIKIRKPKRIADTKISEKAQKRNVIKSSPCYFHLYHKQGCFLESEECCYKH